MRIFFLLASVEFQTRNAILHECAPLTIFPNTNFGSFINLKFNGQSISNHAYLPQHKHLQDKPSPKKHTKSSIKKSHNITCCRWYSICSWWLWWWSSLPMKKKVEVEKGYSNYHACYKLTMYIICCKTTQS